MRITKKLNHIRIRKVIYSLCSCRYSICSRYLGDISTFNWGLSVELNAGFKPAEELAALYFFNVFYKHRFYQEI